MSDKITDRYGNTIGKIENVSDGKYVVEDNLSNKVASVEKEFLGENYNIYDRSGNNTGRIEKEFLGSNYEIRDRNGVLMGKTRKEIFRNGTVIEDSSGRESGRITTDSGISSGAALMLVAIVIIGYFSISSVPHILGEAGWVSGTRNDGSFYLNVYFFCITLPLIIMGAVNIISLLRKKVLFKNATTFKEIVLNEILLGFVLYLGSITIVALSELISGEGLFAALFAGILIAIYLLFAYLLLMLPLSAIFAAILRNAHKN